MGIGLKKKAPEPQASGEENVRGTSVEIHEENSVADEGRKRKVPEPPIDGEETEEGLLMKRRKGNVNVEHVPIKAEPRDEEYNVLIKAKEGAVNRNSMKWMMISMTENILRCRALASHILTDRTSYTYCT